MKCRACKNKKEDFEVLEIDGKTYCEDCVEALFDLCPFCQEFVKAGSLVEVEVDGEMEEICPACAEAEEHK